MNEIFNNAPESRSCDTLGNALTSLSGFYKAGEEKLFTHDVAFLYAGLSSSWQCPSPCFYYNDQRGGINPDLALQNGSLDPKFYTNPDGSTDGDGNVHHWAWTFALGYNWHVGAGNVNWTREWQQRGLYGGNINQSDVLIGDAAIGMGTEFRTNGFKDTNFHALIADYLGVGQ